MTLALVNTARSVNGCCVAQRELRGDSVPVRGGAAETILGAAIRTTHAAMLGYIQKYFGMGIPEFHGIGGAMQRKICCADFHFTLGQTAAFRDCCCAHIQLHTFIKSYLNLGDQSIPCAVGARLPSHTLKIP